MDGMSFCMQQDSADSRDQQRSQEDKQQKNPNHFLKAKRNHKTINKTHLDVFILWTIPIGGGNSNIFGIFTPNPWGDDPIWRRSFPDGWKLNHQLDRLKPIFTISYFTISPTKNVDKYTNLPTLQPFVLTPKTFHRNLTRTACGVLSPSE